MTHEIHQDDHRFMLFDAGDIRDGLGDTDAGWVMGSFITTDDSVRGFRNQGMGRSDDAERLEER